MNRGKLKKPGARGTAFLFIVLVSGFLFGGWRVCAASGSDAPWTLFEIQSRLERIVPVQCPSEKCGYPVQSCRSMPGQHGLLLSDRTETPDRVIYGTDPDMERAMDDQIREEKEKEDKAWKMLQNMNIYQGPRKPRKDSHPVSGDNVPQQ